MAIVGYLSLEEANRYIETRYVSTDDTRLEWESLSEEDQLVYLQRAFGLIELLPYRGRKFKKGQFNAFPRWPHEEVPEAVKHAQVEEAMHMLKNSSSEEAAFYDTLWQYGVESYSLGNLSESSSNGSWGHSRAQGNLPSTVEALLRPYLTGGFNI